MRDVEARSRNNSQPATLCQEKRVPTPNGYTSFEKRTIGQRDALTRQGSKDAMVAVGVGNGWSSQLNASPKYGQKTSHKKKRGSIDTHVKDTNTKTQAAWCSKIPPKRLRIQVRWCVDDVGILKRPGDKRKVGNQWWEPINLYKSKGEPVK